MNQGRQTMQLQNSADGPSETENSHSGKQRKRKIPVYGFSSLPAPKRKAQEKPAEDPYPREQHEEKRTKGKKDPFQEVIEQLKMKKHLKTPLTVQDILAIDSESFKDSEPREVSDLPQHFLRKLVALCATARSTQLVPHFSNLNENNTRYSINPLDMLCVLMHCSDNFLQQDILQKMSMCQFSLPLLLPPCDGTKYTFMLWAMRDIVKKWTPHSLIESKGFREESLVLIPMPTISFVRLGSCGFSKSGILNKVLSPPCQDSNFFIHQDMESGNVPRKISDGLVEIAWYFPSGRKNSDILPESVAFTNLRGDFKSHELQFKFLTKVSSAVFIFLDKIDDYTYKSLSSLNKYTSQFYFISPKPLSKEIVEMFHKLQFHKSRLVEKSEAENSATFVKKLQKTISDITRRNPVTLESMTDIAVELGFQVNENFEECQRARECAHKITVEIKDLEQYKKNTMELQGDQWKMVSKVEKELCRMKSQGATPPEMYRSQLTCQLVDLRKRHQEYRPPEAINNFISGIELRSQEEKHYFLKWMKFYLDSHVRNTLSTLRGQYRENSSRRRELNNKISASCLGVEHFMRELGQTYEATFSKVTNGKMRKRRNLPYSHLPGLAADLLLEGFPLELIDGDASNIPLQWVTDVLTELNTKLDGRSTIRVITVLGVQSTGKSTLLNTMFGLQFAVSSGRCTRGAFMLLIKVKETLRQKLGCDIILVIDTEGLKAPELATLEDSYEHDNELATLVIGLSDITIVTMAMENTTEMKNILQIVAHAFLRMKAIGKKPKCQFVHQNVSDVSAYEQNMMGRNCLLEQLNKMTKRAAEIEKQSNYKKFTDIMDFVADEDSWYIPSLWHGVPPMAPVDTGYSEKVHKLKKHLFMLIAIRSQSQEAHTIISFTEWVKSLWNAVKHENFIFSFRNSLVADAYNQLSRKFSEWEWNFRKEMHLWVAEAENKIHNQSPDNDEVSDSDYEQKLQDEGNKMLQCLQSYFSVHENRHLIEKYREEFIRSINDLKNELKNHTEKKTHEAILIKSNTQKIEDLETTYMKLVDEQVLKLLEYCRERKCEYGNEELETEFEKTWKEVLLMAPPCPLEIQRIDREMHAQLKKDLLSVPQEELNKKGLLECGNTDFKVKSKHYNLPNIKRLSDYFLRKCRLELHSLSEELICKCQIYVNEKVNSKVDYNTTYCAELLRKINRMLKKKDVQRFGPTHSFEVDLKFHILGRAAKEFQTMHTTFVHENNPQKLVDKMKPQYLTRFKDLYLEKDDSQKRAKDFCELCLKPALTVFVNKRLGIEVLNDLQNGEKCKIYSSPSFFQYTLLTDLLIRNTVEGYKQYLTNYNDFVKKWINRHIQHHYTEDTSLDLLEKQILSTITKKIREVIGNSTSDVTNTVASFIGNICKMLQSDIVIRKNTWDMFLPQNTGNVLQFSADVQSYLPKMEHNILTQSKALSAETKLSNIPLKLEDELFRRVNGCGKQCPFCKAPCEAGSQEHKEHFVSIHRPQAFGLCTIGETKKLEHSLCSSHVNSNIAAFRSIETQWNIVLYRDYRTVYPDWSIKPDASLDSSDYWKYVLKEFNGQFAEEYKVDPADYPSKWNDITKEDALESLQKAFNVKQIDETNAIK